MFSDFLEIHKNHPESKTSFGMSENVFNVGKIGPLNVLYAPLLGTACICDNDFLRSLPTSPESSDISRMFPKPDGRFDGMSLLLTSDCNLKCLYCFAKGGENKKTMSFETAKAAVDFMRKMSKNEQLQVLFHGGGEPTLEFSLMKNIVEYIKSKGDAKFSLQTNGFFSEEVAEWISDNIHTLSVSCDGPPYIHDSQRPLKNGGRSSPVIERNIRYFVENSANLHISCVISKFSVNKQNEILEYFNKLGVKKIKFVPVHEVGRCLTCRTLYTSAPDINLFFTNLLKTMELADAYGIELYSTGSTNIIRNKPCGFSDSFIVTPDCFITPCITISEGNSEFKEFIFGHFDEKNRVVLNSRKRDFLSTRVVPNVPRCQNCFLKWNCAGGCPIYACSVYKKDIFSPDARYCRWIKKSVKESLFYKIQKDLIRIKPFLEERAGRIFYIGVYNELKLDALSAKKPEFVILKADVDKSLYSLAKTVASKNPKLLLLSFRITEKDLNFKTGKRIQKFLRELKSKKINFIITKPLPRCLFDQYEDIAREFNIPKNCESCLELFVLKGNSFRLCKSNKKLPKDKIRNRKEIHDVFRSSVRKFHPHCEGCVYLIRKKCNGLC